MSGCPVDHGKKKEEMVVPSSGCPIDHSQMKKKGNVDGQHQKQYNVYGEEINPTNLMSARPSQLPVPGQASPLSQNREISSIPKGGTDEETWTYPSPQMFYNALVRKNKDGGVHPDEVDVVVSIHNNMNEFTWQKVIDWESKILLGQEPGAQGASAQADSKLLKFQGHPSDPSPLSRWRRLQGLPKPFDRHDWVVQRGNGATARYIIDYYYEDVKNSSNDGSIPSQIVVEVRPALDSFAAFRHRLSAWASRWVGNGQLGGLHRPPDVRPRIAAEKEAKERASVESSSAAAAAEEEAPAAAPAEHETDAQAPHAHIPGIRLQPPRPDESISKAEFHFLSSLNAEKVHQLSGEIASSCERARQAVVNCTDDENCARAHTALKLCVGRIVCSEQASAFTQLLHKSQSSEEEVSQSFTELDNCLQRFALTASKVTQTSAPLSSQSKDEVKKLNEQ